MALNIISNFAANVATRNLDKTDAQVEKALVQEERRLWRCLLIMVKAKCEWVATASTP